MNAGCSAKVNCRKQFSYLQNICINASHHWAATHISTSLQAWLSKVQHPLIERLGPRSTGSLLMAGEQAFSTTARQPADADTLRLTGWFMAKARSLRLTVHPLGTLACALLTLEVNKHTLIKPLTRPWSSGPAEPQGLLAGTQRWMPVGHPCFAESESQSWSLSMLLQSWSSINMC